MCAWVVPIPIYAFILILIFCSFCEACPPEVALSTSPWRTRGQRPGAVGGPDVADGYLRVLPCSPLAESIPVYSGWTSMLRVCVGIDFVRGKSFSGLIILRNPEQVYFVTCLWDCRYGQNAAWEQSGGTQRGANSLPLRQNQRNQSDGIRGDFILVPSWCQFMLWQLIFKSIKNKIKVSWGLQNKYFHWNELSWSFLGSWGKALNFLMT